MKILHLVDWYTPGLGYQENYLPLEQITLGHEVRILTSDRLPYYIGYQNNVGKFFSQRIIGKGDYFDKGIPVTRLPMIFEIKKSGFIMFYGIFQKLSKFQPDVIHIHQFACPAALLTIIYSYFFNYKIFIDDHSHKNNFIVNSLPKKLFIVFLQIFYLIFKNRVNGWLPVTYSAEDILKTYYSIPQTKIHLLHLGVNSDIYKPSIEERNITRASLNISDQILIISAGKFYNKKDIHILIEAISFCSDEYPDILLLLVGGGSLDYMSLLRDLIRKYHMEDKVIFKDFVENTELAKYYNSADIGIWPGDHSITAIEALGTELPLILPDDDIAYEIVLSNGAALGFHRGDVQSLANKIKLLIKEPSQRLIIIDKVKNLVEDQLNWHSIAKKSLEIYSTN